MLDLGSFKGYRHNSHKILVDFRLSAFALLGSRQINSV